MSDWTIGRLGKGFVLVFWQGGRRRRYRLGNDASEARRLAPSLYAELTKPRTASVADIREGYVRQKEGRAVVGTMRHTWKALRDRFGPLRADSVTVADCRAHTAQRRAAGVKDGTIHTELGHLRTVLRWAGKESLIVTAPEGRAAAETYAEGQVLE